ncbi:VP2 [Gokushovirus WZ-2015a]|nr:VP2 [Gokushovirus WZ-2015a]
MKIGGPGGLVYTSAGQSASSQMQKGLSGGDMSNYIEEMKKIATEQRNWDELQAIKEREWNAEQAQLNRDFQTSSAEKAMQFNSEEAQKNRDWQEMMSNSAVQRRMEDLKKAGINPILSAGSEAATTGGATASGQAMSGSSASTNRVTTDAYSILSQGITSAKQLAQQKGIAYGQMISGLVSSGLGMLTGYGLGSLNSATQIEIAKMYNSAKKR